MIKSAYYDSIVFSDSIWTLKAIGNFDRKAYASILPNSEIERLFFAGDAKLRAASVSREFAESLIVTLNLSYFS